MIVSTVMRRVPRERRHCTDFEAAARLAYTSYFPRVIPLSQRVLRRRAFDALLAWLVEGATVRWSWSLAAAIVFLVIGASILAVNALHTLMRHGEAARVSSLMYLPPAIAVALELALFGIVPSGLSLLGMAATSLGVALVMWPTRRQALA